MGGAAGVGGGASWQTQQRPVRPTEPDTSNTFFAGPAHGGAAACPRDRERSFPTVRPHLWQPWQPFAVRVRVLKAACFLGPVCL